MPSNISLKDIRIIYSDKIKDIEDKINKNNFQRDIDKLNKDIRDIIKLKENVKKIFVELKQYNCDIWYEKDNSKNIEYIEKINEVLESCSLIKINDLIDTRVRYIEFWLAVHYYECRWCLKENLLTDKQRGKNFGNIIESFYKRLAMVTPCMVMTFLTLPGQFKIYKQNDKLESYLYNFIDLLIVDEAGQVSPEVAAASFSLAKRAIVVGDEDQISPVWGIQPALDEGLAKKSGILKGNVKFETLRDTGINTSESSVMKVAINSSYYSKHNKGLFLSEHRRCYDEIIEYCNELVYDGNLKPCRGKGALDEGYPLKNLYPHMGYKNIQSISKRKGCSRINEAEAEKIAQWLSENYDKIINLYREQNNKIKENEVIAIITPFKQQVYELNRYLKKYLCDKASNISVGTVHTFQGAERKVIILSTVYGDKEGCYFIDKNRSLMNVAVSRSKDAFWIFGSRGCLDRNVTTTSGILRKYTDNEII